MSILSEELNEQSLIYFSDNNPFKDERYWRNKAYEELISDKDGFPGAICDCSVLEFGIGAHQNLINISKYASELCVLEGSSTAIYHFKEKYPDLAEKIYLVETLFEDYNCDKAYDRIIMSFILEHVDDPLFILRKYRKHLSEDGKLIVVVPNSESLHRRIAYKMSLLEDMEMLSEFDIKVGHQRWFNVGTLHALLRKSGYDIIDTRGLFLKPLTTSQLKELGLGDSFYNALGVIGYDYPELCSSLVVVAEKSKGLE